METKYKSVLGQNQTSATLNYGSWMYTITVTETIIVLVSYLVLFSLLVAFHVYTYPGADPGFQVGGVCVKIFGIFRVKNHDFMPKNFIFSKCGGRRENFWGISCEKS